MHSSQLTAARVAGALLAGLSLVTAARWVLPWEAVAALVPGSRNVGFANPLLFGMASIGIFAAEAAIVQAPRHRWLAQLNKLAIALLLVLPLLQLFQTLSGLNFGLDLPSPGSGPTTSVPGRLSPNACIAFTCIGLALWLLPRPRSRGWERAYLASTLVVAFIGLAALAGYFLRLETLYQVANHNRLLPVTALGFVVASAALWALHVRTQAFDLRDAAKRIQRRSLAVVTLLTLSAGVAGFASMRDTFEESAANTMLQSTVNNATSLAYSLDTALWYPKTLATRPTVLQGLERLSRDPADAQARAALQNIATSFLKAELSQAEFYNAQGEMVAGVGVSVGKETKVRHPLLNTGQDAVLAWGADGYYLLTDNPVQLDGRPVGRLKTEQPLRLVNQLLEQMRLADATSDAALCGRSGDKALCAATRFRQPAFELPLHGVEGQAASAIANALEGRTGMLFARDPRNKEVLTAYAPLKQYGLALGFKTDLDTLYAPLRSRLLLLLAAMALLIALAIYALRSQVQPVLMRLVES
ncbi:MAG TPA: hypothetical protein VFL64_04705, partial [Rhizobacter sp.]|nr:hypothetical protein [Rhizobacter sp.]